MKHDFDWANLSFVMAIESVATAALFGTTLVLGWVTGEPAEPPRTIWGAACGAFTIVSILTSRWFWWLGGMFIRGVRGVVAITLLIALTASAQLTTPRAKPTADRPMAKAAPTPKALAVVPIPVPTPGIRVRKLSWTPVAQAVRYDLKWYPNVGDESTGTDPFYDLAEYLRFTTNRVSVSLTGAPPWKLELQSINAAGMASTNVTLIYWDQLVLDYYRQVADNIAGPWREDAQPFSTITNPVGLGVTRIRVDKRRQ